MKYGKILIGIPAYKRPNLLRINLQYTVAEIQANLIAAGFGVDMLVVGSSSEEGDAVREFPTIEYLEIPNYLSNKKNLILERARHGDYDFLIWLDSDDFVPIKLLAQLLVTAKRNGLWASVASIYFFDAASHRLIFFEGYRPGHELSNQGLGTARVFTKRLIKLLPENVFGINRERSMDSQMAPYLNALNVHPSKRLLHSEYHSTILGVKTSQNIWSMEDYESKSFQMLYGLDSYLFDWLPQTTREQLLELSFESP